MKTKYLWRYFFFVFIALILGLGTFFFVQRDLFVPVFISVGIFFFFSWVESLLRLHRTAQGLKEVILSTSGFFSILVLCFLYYYRGWSWHEVRTMFLGWVALAFFAAISLYSLRKRYIPKIAPRRWKLSPQQKDELGIAQTEIKELQAQVLQGKIRHPAEARQLGQRKLAKMAIKKLYYIAIQPKSPGKFEPILQRKEPWGKLHHWYSVHVYLGLGAFLLCLIHANFFWGKSLLTQLLSFCLWMTTLTGLIGWFLQRTVPLWLTKWEAQESLEHLIHLRERVRKFLEQIRQNRSEQFQKSLRLVSLRTSQEDFLTQECAKLPEEERDTFFQAAAAKLQIAQIQRRARKLLWLHFLLKRWILLHLPFSLALWVLTLIHVISILYF